MIRYEKFWPVLESFVQRALDRGSIYTLEEIKEGHAIGKFQAWSDDDLKAVLITALQEDHERFCLLLALSGENMRDWLPLLSYIEQWASLEGAKSIRIYGRKGWSRVVNYPIIGKDGTAYIMSKGL